MRVEKSKNLKFEKAYLKKIRIIFIKTCYKIPNKYIKLKTWWCD